MARVKFNPTITEVRGAVGRIVCRQMYGRGVLSTKPEPRPRVRSTAEAATNNRFKLAVQAAKNASPELVARYDERARQENRSRFSIRTRDYLVPPSIPAVFLGCYSGQRGEPILVIARDDFEVKELRVTLRTRDGATLESGVATRCPADVFRYDTTNAATAGAEIDVEITAHDWAGNVTPWCGTVTVPAR